jgi:hypothetical protein
MALLKDSIYNGWKDSYGIPSYPEKNYRSFEDEIRMRLETALKEIDYWREEVKHIEETKRILTYELESLQKYVKLIELALHIGIGDDEKKREVLKQAKKSIEVLQIFEKETLK